MTLPFDTQAAISHLKNSDTALEKLIETVGHYSLDLRDDRPILMVILRSIVYQQLSDRAASTIFDRVEALVNRNSGSPEEILVRLSVEELRSAGMSQAKIRAAKDLAARASSGLLPSRSELEQIGDEEIVRVLTQIRGVGPWTVQMLLMFYLGRPDVLPTTDLGVRKGFMLTYGLDDLPDAAYMTSYAERWRPYRSVASWYMWRAVDLHLGTRTPQL